MKLGLVISDMSTGLVGTLTNSKMNPLLCLMASFFLYDKIHLG